MTTNVSAVQRDEPRLAKARRRRQQNTEQQEMRLRAKQSKIAIQGEFAPVEMAATGSGSAASFYVLAPMVRRVVGSAGLN